MLKLTRTTISEVEWNVASICAVVKPQVRHLNAEPGLKVTYCGSTGLTGGGQTIFKRDDGGIGNARGANSQQGRPATASPTPAPNNFGNITASFP
jgi:hypothetical protein